MLFVFLTEHRFPYPPQGTFGLVEGEFRRCQPVGLSDRQSQARGTGFCGTITPADVGAKCDRLHGLDIVLFQSREDEQERRRQTVEYADRCVVEELARIPALQEIRIGNNHRLLIETTATPKDRADAEKKASYYAERAMEQYRRDWLLPPLFALAVALAIPALLIFGVPWLGPALFRTVRGSAAWFASWVLYGPSGNGPAQDR